MYAEPEFDTSTAEPQESTPWREEVASRINSYRARRRHKNDDDYSMRLDFNTQSPPSQAHEAIVAAVAEKYALDDETADINYYRRLNHEAIEVEAGSAADVSLHSEADIVADDPFNFDLVPADASPVDPTAEPVIVVYDPTTDPDFDFDKPRELDSNGEPVANASRPARRSEPKPKVIHFPRPAGMEPPIAPPAYDFAEPVLDRPRIMDVPEDTMPTIRGPLFADIRLDDSKSHDALEPKFGERIEVPLQVAAMNQRVFSGLIDSLIVVIASVIFGVIAWNVLPEIPRTKEMGALALAIPAVFWFVYQYVFLVYAGQTTGMQMAQLRLSTFDGKQPTWEERRYRALAMLLSCISVGLGFVWSMIDEDQLCWHDKISRTYPVQGR
jgi:uncharacterized RDD family membrane protein YckC